MTPDRATLCLTIETDLMYIGKAAQLSGTTVKSIRHYEEIGLLPEPKREGKYRIYSQQSVEVLTFIKCAQQLGFKLKELQVILNNYRGDEFPWDMAQRAIAEKSRTGDPDRRFAAIA